MWSQTQGMAVFSRCCAAMITVLSWAAEFLRTTLHRATPLYIEGVTEYGGCAKIQGKK